VTLPALEPLQATVAARAEETEVARRLPPDLVDELAAAGLFALAVPKSLGGPECHPRLIVDAVETISAGDGAAGWCVMIGSTSSVLAAYLPEAEAALIYGSPRVITGGAFAPSGRATAANGGYSVTGRWAWASGCQHCDWLVGGCRRTDDDQDVTLCFFPAAEVEIIDTWHTSGLRGTGSHDIAVDGLLVPGGQSVSLFSGAPVEDGPLYRFPVFGLLALGIAAVALGIARGAVADVRELAAPRPRRAPFSRGPSGSGRSSRVSSPRPRPSWPRPGPWSPPRSTGCGTGPRAVWSATRSGRPCDWRRPTRRSPVPGSSIACTTWAAVRR
jgi:alkylation response protein AidB-like acyl-CoA dehydrogenase